MTDAGVLPRFTGVAVHDAWAPYDTFTDATHALCGAHVLRELTAVIDLAPAGAFCWARQAHDALLDLKALTDLTGMLGRDTSIWTDDVWVVDSTPVECARSRDTVKRSDLAGWAEYGYCASHSRFFWGLRLHLVATLHGLPIGFALTGAKADERQVLLGLLHQDPHLTASRPGQILIADKNYYGREFEADLASQGIRLLRRARKGEPERPGGKFFRPLRQTVESIFDTLKGQLDLERHGGHTTAGVLVRVLQRMLALTTARSGTTTTPDSASDDPYSPTTTDTPWNRSSSCVATKLVAGQHPPQERPRRTGVERDGMRPGRRTVGDASRAR